MKNDRMQGRGGRPRARRAALALAAALGLAAPAAAAQEAGGVDDARAVLEQWVETRRVISRERRDWALGKEVLADRIGLVQREIEALRGRIDEANRSVTDADAKLADLVAQNERLTAASASLDGAVVALEQGLRALLPRLPDPIRERIAPLSQRLPAPGGAEVRQSLSERFQNIVGILNEVTKFNREITVTSEVRALGDGATAEVTAVYVGIGHGYYASARGDAAGVGAPTAEGWAWTPADEHAAQIARAIAILKNEQVAAYVPLPVRITPEGEQAP